MPDELEAIADDTGLEVEALGGEPGVYASRYAGETATYKDKFEKLLCEVVGVPREQRRARLVAVGRRAADRPISRRGVLEGLITGRDDPGSWLWL